MSVSGSIIGNFSSTINKMHVLFANTGVQLVCVPLRGGAATRPRQIGYGWQRCRCGSGAGERSAAAVSLHPVADHPGGHDQALPGRRHHLRRSRGRLLLLAQRADQGLRRPPGRAAGPRGPAAEGRARRSSCASARPRPPPATPSTSTWSSISATAAPARCCWSWPARSARRRRCCPSSWSTATISTPGTRRASTSACPPPGGSPRRPTGATRPTCRRCRRRRPSTTRSTRTRPRRLVRPRQGSPSRPRWRWSSRRRCSTTSRMVRMGREADDVVQVMRAEGDIRTGVSSPKRYLWADDASWLEGANWHMADPADRCQTGTYAATLKGPFLQVRPRGRPRLPARRRRAARRTSTPREAPLKPRHAPRALMTAALYEMLCQAYTYVNSMAYRNASGDAGRAREIRTLTLSYPSGMIQEEQQRLAAQAQKAINIFAMTLGKNQRVQAGAEPEHRRGQRRPPDLHLERDADAGPGPAAVVRHACTRTAAKKPSRSRKRPPSRMAAAPAGRRRVPRPGHAAARRPRRAAAASRRRSATRPTKSASPASTSAAARPT